MNEDDLDLLRIRMQAISIGHLAIRYTLRWDEVPPIKVYFGEDQGKRLTNHRHSKIIFTSS